MECPDHVIAKASDVDLQSEEQQYQVSQGLQCGRLGYLGEAYSVPVENRETSC